MKTKHQCQIWSRPALYLFVVELGLNSAGLAWPGLDVDVERKYLFCAESTGRNT